MIEAGLRLVLLFSNEIELTDGEEWKEDDSIN